MRLAAFLHAHRASLSRRWVERVRYRLRSEEALSDEEIIDSLQQFLDETIQAVDEDRTLPGTGSAVAAAHGAQRQLLQRDVADMVREYGLLFEVVVEEARAKRVGPFAPEEYARLVAVLSKGASEATREFAKLRALDLRRQAWEHFAFLAHELRSPLQTARMAAQLMRSGVPHERGMQVLERSLAHVADAIDHALVDARMRGIDAGAPLRREMLDVRELISGAVDEIRPDAEAREIEIAIEIEKGLRASADDRVLRSAIGNLLRNAVKFTRTGGRVTVRARGATIEVQDECGGLRPGDEGRIFDAFRQTSENRSGFGLGLAIARQAIEAHGGTLSVRNLPGSGCVFVATLARA